MAFQVPSTEPAEVSAGDRLQWTKTLADFPPSEGWTLTYYLRANVPNGQIDLAAATSGTGYAVDVSPDTTAGYTPATYSWQAFVSKTGSRHQVGSGTLKVNPNFTEITEPYDGRSQARRILDAIDLVIEGRASSDVQRYVMQAVGRSVDKMTIADLLKFRDYWLTEVKKEEAMASGLYKKNIFIRFT